VLNHQEKVKMLMQAVATSKVVGKGSFAKRHLFFSPCDHSLKKTMKKLRHLFLNAVASLSLRLWFGSTCAFGAMH
jgi:hypothetical protein